MTSGNDSQLPSESPPPVLPSNGQNAERRFVHRSEHRSATPRKVRNGVKLQGKLPLNLQQPFARRWLHVIESQIPHAQLAQGAEYARLGQVVSMTLSAGLIEAQVQGTAARPYVTQLRVPALSTQQWQAVIDAMSREAVHVAKLLAGELPPNLEELFASAGMTMLPAPPDGLAMTCSCGEEAPCKHAAAIGYLVAEHFEHQPLEVFTVLGLPLPSLLDHLRQARSHVRDLARTGDGTERRPAAVLGDPMIPESQIEPLPLEACLDDYWRIGARMAELETPPPQHVQHALLRRLGPSPLAGKFPMVGLLASIYDTVSAAARSMSDNDSRES
jgi:uncharacterized Zn finger protein